jgi:hypothetical protein
MGDLCDHQESLSDEKIGFFNSIYFYLVSFRKKNYHHIDKLIFIISNIGKVIYATKYVLLDLLSDCLK